MSTPMAIAPTHRVMRRWDIGPFVLYEAEPLCATQDWRDPEYFVALPSRWLQRESFPTLSSALMAMARHLDAHNAPPRDREEGE